MGSTIDLHTILWHDLPKHLSEDDYELIITMLKEAYKASFVELNNNQAQYNNTVADLKSVNNSLLEQLEYQKRISNNFRSKLSQNLTLKERILGKIDLNRLTQITDKADQA